MIQDAASFLHKKLAVDVKMTSVQARKIENQMMSKFLVRLDSIIMKQMTVLSLSVLKTTAYR